MNTPFQDELLQGGTQENEAVDTTTYTQEGDSAAPLDRSGQRAATVQVKEAVLVNKEWDQLAYPYRTRWIAWCIITAGWASSLAAVMMRGGAVEWFMLSVFSMIIIISGLAPIMAAKGLTAMRMMSQEMTREGGKLEISLRIKRSLLIPIVWIAISDETSNESSSENTKISVRTVLMPMFRQEMTYRYTLHNLRRGRYPFEPISITVGDWLGLSAIHKRLYTAGEFVVLPGLPYADQVHKAERARGTALYAVQSSTADPSTDHLGDAGREEINAAVSAAGLGPDSRPYREGDSLRHLDWRSAAKGRGLQTKIHPLERPAKTVIAVDTLASAYGQDDRLFDACVGWASLALAQSASLGHAVTLLLGQGTPVMQSSVDGGTQSDLSEMLHAMALLRADGKGSLAGRLAEESNLQARGSTILVFTADWRGGRSWGELAGFAGEQGCRLELFIIARSNVPTFAMREQQKWLESGGVKVTWLHVPSSMNALPYAEEGGDIHELA
ncbi:DUF58 domain-containing protein [Paenibacillus sp. FSL K6-3182]|uniref:DUF58 domain-containing protein n=1 Tax=Paenibacillus sp. FSL K6-3182 TaxID=2921495 RepID=UPI0030D4539A